MNLTEEQAKALADHWVTRLEQEYWENAPCHCKALLAHLFMNVANANTFAEIEEFKFRKKSGE